MTVVHQFSSLLSSTTLRSDYGLVAFVQMSSLGLSISIGRRVETESPPDVIPTVPLYTLAILYDVMNSFRRYAKMIVAAHWMRVF